MAALLVLVADGVYNKRADLRELEHDTVDAATE